MLDGRMDGWMGGWVGGWMDGLNGFEDLRKPKTCDIMITSALLPQEVLNIVTKVLFPTFLKAVILILSCT